MKRNRILLTALSLLIMTGMMFGQAGKTAKGEKPVMSKKDKVVITKANPNSFCTANMDPGFVPSTVNPTVPQTLNGTKAITGYGFNAYGGTVAVGPVSIDIPAGTLTSLAANANWTAGADWADGVWYGVQYASSGNCPLVTLNPTSGVVTTIGGGAPSLTGLAYDINTGIMYAMDFSGTLFTVNLSTGATTTVGSAAMASCIGIACDNLGLIYAIDLDDNLYSINSSTAAKTLVGPLGVAIGYAQDIAYDRDNEKLYGTLYTTSGGLYEINKTTGAATLLFDFVSEVTGFAIPYTPVADDAPAAVSNFTVTPAALGALTADAAWDNPSLTYTGNTLTELLTATLLVDNNPVPVYQNSSPTIGGAESYTHTVSAAGFYKFSAYGSNTAGDGEMTHITVWIGEDVPAAPANVVLTNPSGMDASLAWDAPTTGLHSGYFSGTGVTYDVIRMPGNVLVSNDQTGLTFAETIASPGNYYYTVVASNASGVGGDANSNVILFGDFLIYEDFEGLFPNTGWSVVPNTATWAQSTGTVHPSGNPAHSPDKLAYFNSWTIETGTASLITPTVDMTGIVGQLDYWMFHEPGYSGSNDNVQLKMSTNGGTTWTNVGAPVSRYAATAAWTKNTYIITGGTATTKFNFFATSAYGNDIHIDDVTLFEITGCIQPSNLSAVPSDISAVLDWTENSTATAWEIEWGTPGFTQGTGTVAAVAAKPYTLSGLTAYTSYEYYVRADCGGSSYSPWVGPFSFTTIGCPVANQCTYTYTMTDSWGDGWNDATITVTEDGHVINVITLLTGGTGSGSLALCEGTTVTLTWAEGDYDEECGFTLLDPSGVNVLNFAAGAAPLAGPFYTFSACPTCPAPSALNATGITQTAATLGWTPNGSETLWNIEWGAGSFALGSGTAVAGLTSPTYPLSGLTLATAYSFYVQADCGGGDQSSWSGPYTFYTQCDVISTFPWFDDFEAGISCYNISGINTAETWYYDAAAGDPYSGVANVTIEYDPALNPADEWIKSPIFDISSLTDPQITFFWNMSYYWGVDPNDNYDVFLKGTTNGTTWTDIWTEPTNTFTNWTWYDTTMSLAAFSGANTFQFAFNYVGSDGAAFYLDDVTIDNITSNSPVVYKPFIVYPNPTTGMLYISETVSKVEVTNMLGQVIDIKSNVQKVDLGRYNQGVYFVKVTKDNETSIYKITLVK